MEISQEIKELEARVGEARREELPMGMGGKYKAKGGLTYATGKRYGTHRRTGRTGA